MTRVGLFGGSFDPVHNAHVALARLALVELQLDSLLWVPVGIAWQKERPLSAAQHRAAMVQLAIAGEPRFALERCELDRAGPSYTLDTVRELQQRMPAARFYLVIGGDQYAGLHTWEHWPELLARVQLVVASRAGVPLAPNPALGGVVVHTLALPPMAISATEVRRRAASGADISDMVPPPVARYIGLHHLYT